MTAKKNTFLDGFTIIELTIVVITLSILFVVGFAGFRSFSQGQQVDGALGQIKGDLRFAQEAALAGKKPVGCGFLNGYLVRYMSATSYQLYANCDNNVNVVLPEKPLSDFSTFYPRVVINSSFSDIFFRVLGRGVISAVTVTLRNTSTSQTKSISVTSGGQIN
jgi:Tfp pilus assembly protein FimT